MIALLPFFGETEIGGFRFKLITMAILLSATYAIAEKKRLFILAIVLAVPAVIAPWLYLFYDLPGAQIWNVAFTLLFLVFITAIILGDVLRGEEVTTDNINGGICVYLLIGFTWTMLYWIAEIYQPGSFLIAGSKSSLTSLKGVNLVYFSYVTLTTLGYGDITPVSAHARSLSILEAITGVLYIAIFIARLIGLHHQRSKK